MALASRRAPTSRRGTGRLPYVRPLTVADPASGASRPMIIRIVVDLPDPFGPRNPVTCPGFTSKDRSSTATLSLYRFVTPMTSITIWSPLVLHKREGLQPIAPRLIHGDESERRNHQASGYCAVNRRL